MNLLRIQDALKNASDDQLMGLLRSPDATAPSYLVLSEIKRRKDMRAQQPEEPQGTVAEDLAKESTYDDQGIRSLKTPGYEEEAQRSDDDSIQGMRRGGVVRMQGGGGVEDYGLYPEERDLINPSRLFQRLRDYRAGTQQLREGLINPPGPPSPQPSPFGEEPINPQASAELRSPSAVTEPSLASSIPNIDYSAANEPPPAAAFAPPGQRGSAAPAATTSAAGAGGAGRPGSAGGIGALGSGGSPDFDRLYAANMARFPGLPADLQERMRAMRTKPEEQRSKALNMSLIEAGLRMMASKNPSLLGSIGESAVPAVQSYAQQQAQIRKDQREDIKDEMSVAQANLARAYYAGQITAAQYRTAVSELGANARAALAANAQVASAERTAAGLESRERIAAGRDAAAAQRAADLALNTALRNPELRNQTRLNLQMERTQAGNRTPVTESEVSDAIRNLGIRPGAAAAQGSIVVQDGVQRYVRPGS